MKRIEHNQIASRFPPMMVFFFFQAEYGIRDRNVTGVQTCALPIYTLIPAIGQGALGIECRSDDKALLDLLTQGHNHDVAECVTAERTFLERMNGSCQVPIGGYASKNSDGTIVFTGLIMSPDGKERYEHTERGTNPVELGEKVNEVLNAQCAYEIIKALNEEQ